MLAPNPQSPTPTRENLLMAAAEMHKMGRLNVKTKTPKVVK
jgi:hypothetical protein